MTITLTEPHKKRLEEIRKEVTLLGSKESSFLKVELLFYEALSIAREYGNDARENPLLEDLKKVQESAYEKTNELYKKSSQREVSIRRFIVRFKKVLAFKNILELNS
ncbi:MAG TPA: hypothetical protein VJ499_12060 [Flavisolibacter sp.]|nr:hypothetical protein [Flavisolibacter sp.]